MHALNISDAMTKRLSLTSTSEYLRDLLIQTATFEGIVHGVVVQIIKAIF